MDYIFVKEQLVFLAIAKIFGTCQKKQLKQPIVTKNAVIGDYEQPYCLVPTLYRSAHTQHPPACLVLKCAEVGRAVTGDTA